MNLSVNKPSHEIVHIDIEPGQYDIENKVVYCSCGWTSGLTLTFMHAWVVHINGGYPSPKLPHAINAGLVKVST